MPVDRKSAITALVMSTIAFTVCFACWVINAVLVTHLVSIGIYAFDHRHLGWLLAVPVLTGSLSRLPLGILTDKYGGRGVFTILMLAVSVFMYLLSFADSFSDFLWASAAFGLAGGSFAVGIGYVSVWFEKERQGTALGIFGAGNAGAAATTMLAPPLLTMFESEHHLEGWRMLPKVYAVLMLVTALAFFFLTQDRVASGGKSKTLAQQLKPLGNIVVWRFGLYYFLVFGAFVALAQWILPYSVNVYQVSVAQAGLLAAAFSLPSGVIRAMGGWLSDKFGARTVMRWTFLSCILSCLILSVPKMNISSPGEGVTAKAGGTVTEVSESHISVGDRIYSLTHRPEAIPAKIDTGSMVLPTLTTWQEPVVAAGTTVQKDQLLASGITNIYYPANMWIFAFLILVFGIATGVGKAGVYKFIPDQFPEDVGAVGGMVSLLGALGGFFFPLLFGYLLHHVGLWSTSWMVLTVISVACLFWMERTVRRIEQTEAPELAELLEYRPSLALGHPVDLASGEKALTLETLLQRVPFFAYLAGEQLKEVARAGRTQLLPANSVIFKENDPGDMLYVVLDGTVRVFHPKEQDREVDLARFKGGDWFGELALIDGEPRSASVKTVSPCQTFMLSRTDFLKLLSRSPWMLSRVLLGLTSRLRETSEKMSDDRFQEERVRAQAEIQRHRAISQMVAGVAHEINTPLGIINNAASLLSEKLNPKAILALAKDARAEAVLNDFFQAASLIQSHAIRSAGLVESFKKLSARNVTGPKEQVDFVALTKEALGLYRLEARKSRLQLETVDELGEADRIWEGFPGHYTQVILNLLTNIDRYAYPEGRGGSVRVTVSQETHAGKAPHFRVVVQDFGCGIPKKDLPEVFDAFFTTGRALGGTGLGLAIVHNLVTSSLQGTISISSEPGQGTRVEIQLPKIVQDNKKETPTQNQ